MIERLFQPVRPRKPDLRTRLKAAWRALPAGLHGDYIMAFNRLTAGVAVALVLVLLGDKALIYRWLGQVCCWTSAGLLLFYYLLKIPTATTVRRLLAIIVDASGATTLLLAGGESVSFLYITYLWVIIGNGVRFGGLYILAATLVSLASFSLVALFNPFWHQHVALSLGLLSGIVMLPGYAFALVRQLAQAREAAEQADRAKSLFLASVSHELRTPLTAIMGMAELLRASRLDPHQVDMVATINHAAEGQLSLVQDVLQFSRIEAGHGRGEIASFDVIELLRDVRAVVGVEARKKGLLLNAYITARTPVRLLGDERHLREVLINLAGNAIKFTAAGSVTLAADGFDMGDGAVRFRLEVMDTGIGIAPEAQGRIFELFTQAHDGILNRFGGTGLGLALCERQVRLMGGAIGVESQLHVGSTFWVTLELKRDQVDGLAPPPATMVAGGGNEDWLQEIQQKYGQQKYGPAEEAGVCVAFVQEGNWGVHLPEADAFIQVVEDRVCDLPARAVRERFATTVSQYGSIEELQNAVRIAATLSPAAGVVRRPGAPARVAAPAHKLSGLRVLVADDNSINRSIVAKMLEASDARIVFAGNGEEALEIMSGGQVDVALLDVNMPVMDGIEAAQLYDLSVLGGRRIPLIALTAAAGPDIRERCLKAGMDECLVKPIRMADLTEAIFRIVHRGAPVRPPAAPVEAPVAPPATQILDAQTLLDLKRLGGNEFVENIISQFAQDGLRVLDEIEADFLVHDILAFRTGAHAMRSIAANVGAVALRDACARWEVLGEAELRNDGSELLRRLRRLWHDTMAAFEHHLKDNVIGQG